MGAHRHLRAPVEGRRNLRAVDVRRGLPRHGAHSGQHLGRSVRLPNTCAGSSERMVRVGNGSLVVSGSRANVIVPTVWYRVGPVRGGDIHSGRISALGSSIVDHRDTSDDVPRSYGGNVPGGDRTDVVGICGGGSWFLRLEESALNYLLLRTLELQLEDLCS